MPTRKQLADALRILSMDAVERANSGHPGACLGMADMAEALWRHGFKHNPANPHWVNRDRFILSNGHASMLLYALLYLSGYALSLEDLKNFRQLHSHTPGHPEYGVTAGVDMTTGPLGQGLASAVGMALAERLLAQTYNKPGYNLIDHYTYCFCGDGCLMEGVSSEASSLAGNWGLGRLIVLYDANQISIDGNITAWFNEDVGMRYRAYGWQVLEHVDGHDCLALDQALEAARADQAHPSLIICNTHIGFASPKVDSATCHGAPLGQEACLETRKNLQWSEPPFSIPENIKEAWDAQQAGQQAEQAWQQLFDDYKTHYPDAANELERRIAGKLPANWPQIKQRLLQKAQNETKSLATRQAASHSLAILQEEMPELLGGSADLSESVGTLTAQSVPLNPQTWTGNYIYYGVREFGMSCIMNGLALHGGFMPYGGTFLSFSDQAHNALRLAALMRLRTVWVFTHDSIGVGEDGPTHQPIEQIAVLRMIPNMYVWRPCDAVESAVAWQQALEADRPVSLVLSRQKVTFFDRTPEQIEAIAKGGYILQDCEGQPEIILLATGSEVNLIMATCNKLNALGHPARAVSMPCTAIFDVQPEEWKEYVLPSNVRCRLAVEAASPESWWKYVGLDGRVIGMKGFGLSAPGHVVMEHFGFSADNILQEACKLLKIH